MIPLMSGLKTCRTILDIICGCVCTNSIKTYMGMLNLKTRIVIGSDEGGKWDQEGLYMGISTLSVMLYKFLKYIGQCGKMLEFSKVL